MRNALQSLTEGKSAVGIGTGTTVERCVEKLSRGPVYVPSSIRTAQALGRQGLTMSSPMLHSEIDLYIDGADYFSRDGHLIKGKGGALTTEKLLCSMARDVVIIVQSHKYRETFEGCLVPVEIVPPALGRFMSILQKHGLRHSLREGDRKIGPVVTDLGNYIVDVEYNGDFFSTCKGICGVVEHGLFEVCGSDVVVEDVEDPM